MSEYSRNLHHLSFDRRKHLTRAQRIYRYMGLMTVCMDVDAHNELHRAIRPPEPPNGVVLDAGLDAIKSMQNSHINDPLRVINKLINVYGGLSLNVDNAKVARAAMDQEQFMMDQYKYVQAGRPSYGRSI